MKLKDELDVVFVCMRFFERSKGGVQATKVCKPKTPERLPSNGASFVPQAPFCFGRCDMHTSKAKAVHETQKVHRALGHQRKSFKVCNRVSKGFKNRSKILTNYHPLGKRQIPSSRRY